MPKSKLTLLMNAGTVDAEGNAARVAGFSESYLSVLDVNSTELKAAAARLALARAQLFPANVKIVGTRYQTIDPVGGSRSFDNVVVGNSTAANDLPGVALQWTVRSPTTPNQRSIILRGVPDGRVQSGEYVPSGGFNTALSNFFSELITNWVFRAIDRTVLPVKIISIDAAGLMTTEKPHGLAPNDTAQVMSVKDSNGDKHSFLAFVKTTPLANTATLSVPHELTETLFHSGRVRKFLVIYPTMTITGEEVVNPTAMHRKAGAPFRKFRGRRTVRRR